MEISKILVSVCMITYSHEKYIKQAIEGILMQEMDFDLELVISNDSSPDNTNKIIQHIIKSHPKGQFIKYTNHIKNIGAIPNFYYALNECKGKYIAICEGDDYWTDSRKLQKQVSFLEENSKYNASFHDVDVLLKKETIRFSDFQNSKLDSNIINFSQIISADWLIPTCSFVFRKEKMLFPAFIKEFQYGDFPLFSGLALNSKFHYVTSVMGVYRKNNPNSLTNNKSFSKNVNKSADYILFLNYLRKFALEGEQNEIDKRINSEIKRIYINLKNFEGSRFIKLYQLLSKKLNLLLFLKNKKYLGYVFSLKILFK